MEVNGNEEKIDPNICWCCKKNRNRAPKELQLYRWIGARAISRKRTRHSYKVKRIVVPRCYKCAILHSIVTIVSYSALPVACFGGWGAWKILARFPRYKSIWWVEWTVPAVAGILCFVVYLFGFIAMVRPFIPAFPDDFPSVQKLLSEGWKVGTYDSEKKVSVGMSND